LPFYRNGRQENAQSLAAKDAKNAGEKQKVQSLAVVGADENKPEP
jgi:hypothetical protein